MCFRDRGDLRTARRDCGGVVTRADELILEFVSACDACDEMIRTPHAEPYDFDRAIAARDAAREELVEYARTLRSEAA